MYYEALRFILGSYDLFFFAMKRVRLILRNEPDNAGRLPRNCRKSGKESVS